MYLDLTLLAIKKRSTLQVKSIFSNNDIRPLTTLIVLSLGSTRVSLGWFSGSDGLLEDPAAALASFFKVSTRVFNWIANYKHVKNANWSENICH